MPRKPLDSGKLRATPSARTPYSLRPARRRNTILLKLRSHLEENCVTKPKDAENMSQRLCQVFSHFLKILIDIRPGEEIR